MERKLKKVEYQDCYERSVLVGTKVTENIRILETYMYQLFKYKQLIA